MPEQTFFFYDLETSGTSPRKDRIMQFGGQRTDMDLNPIGEPFNINVKLSPEVIPHPAAVLITGITPQYVDEHGIPEREAVKIFMEEAFTPGTIAVGFNNVRFDDEHIRFTAYRNFYDAYEWCWKDGRSRWDMLDVVRFVRALRPEGIEWPVDEAGQPVNKLELLAKANNFPPIRSHDALSDVISTIQIAKLIKEKQPRLFEYLLQGRKKEAVLQVVDPVNPEPFVYASGRYGKKHGFTTIGYPIGYGFQKKVLVYNLLLNPDDYKDLSVEDLRAKRAATWDEKQEEGFLPFPAKELMPNKCPAVAPYNSLRDEDFARLGFDKQEIADNLEKLRHSDLKEKLQSAFAVETQYPPAIDPDAALYDGFLGDKDKAAQRRVRQAHPDQLKEMRVEFEDERLSELFIRYKGRNYPETLSIEEKAEWETYAAGRKAEDMKVFEAALLEIGELNEEQEKLIEDVKKWAGI